MDEKKTMTLVKTLTMRIMELETNLKNSEEMKNFYLKEIRTLETEVKELKDKYIHNKEQNEEE